MNGARALGMIVITAIAAATYASAADAPAGNSIPIGRKIQDFWLKNQFGKEYALHDFADRDVVVVAFVGTECPLAQLYGPRLAELAKKVDSRRVAIVGIDSNQQDSIQEIGAYAAGHKIEFPILKDPGNAIADQFGAERTPEVFVLDKDRVVRYRGRIDDQYGFAAGVGYQRPAPKRNDLAEAVNELLAGKAVSEPTTQAIGCHIGRVRKANGQSEVTYSKQISRIFQNHCIECHREGRIGPFQMASYEDVVGWGEMIREVVDQGRMPPWHANPVYGHFVNDLRLTDEEKKLIGTWVENGCPEGDRSELPEPKEFVDGWVIGEPDQIVYMGDEPVDVPAEGVIDYYNFVVDPGWKEDKWIRAAEAKPGSPEAVHHILVFVQPPGSSDGDRRQGDLMAGYAPGMNPMLATDGSTAMHVKAGSKLAFQLHYTPNGSPHKDRSYVGLVFAEPEKVRYVTRSVEVSNRLFRIPPGDNNYSASEKVTLEHDTLIRNMTPHMHKRGKSFRYEVTYPNGGKEILLDVPAYDFNWQTTYELKEPKLLPKGTELLCTAHWDNSANNLSNPDPTKTVTWGRQTFEEMMIGFYFEVFPKDQAPERTPGGRRLDPERIFTAFDINGDNKLTKDELPSQAQARFEIADADHNGEVSKEELTALLKMFSGPQRNPSQ
jgi:peroxiredoxin/mono/diheme cytochrome c family protein